MPEREKRVLIADDDAEIRELLTSILQKRELVVDQASNGREALDRLRTAPYAVVLLDLVMPDVDGFAVLEVLRAMNEPPVVLVITGSDRPLEPLDAQRIHGLIRKPFDPEEIAGLVVACAEIRGRTPFEAMAISAMVASGPFLALLNRWT